MEREILKLFYDSGWTVRRTKKNHYKATPPDGGAFLILSSTPSDFRADKKTRCDLRNAGYDIRPDPTTGRERIFADKRPAVRWLKRPREATTGKGAT